MTRYACTQPSCPRREPVTAADAPTCYTCGGKMAEVTTTRATYDPCTAQISFNGVRINGVLDGPFIEIPEPTPRLFDDELRKRLLPVNGATRPDPGEDIDPLDLPLGIVYDSANALALGQRIAADVSAALPPPTVRISAPEPTPEQRARRELGPITVTVTRSAVADPEALQAEILRALATIDREPHNEPPVSFRNEEHVADATPNPDGEDGGMRIRPEDFNDTPTREDLVAWLGLEASR